MTIDMKNGWELELKNDDGALVMVLGHGKMRCERRIEPDLLEYAKGPAFISVLRGAAAEVTNRQVDAMPDISEKVEEVLNG